MRHGARAGLLAAALASGGCAPRVERVYLRLSDQMALDVSGTLSVPEQGEYATPPPPDNPTVRALEACADVRVRYAGSDGRGYYSLSRTGLSTSEMAEFQRCLMSKAVPVVAVRKVESLLSVTYFATFRTILDVRRTTPKEDIAILPKLLTVAMPGDDVTIEEIGDRDAVDIGIEPTAPSEIAVTLERRPEANAAALAAQDARCPARDDACLTALGKPDEWPRAIPVALEVVSVRYKYGFNEVTALIGLIFGSGFAFGIRRWFIARRR